MYAITKLRSLTRPNDESSSELIDLSIGSIGRASLIFRAHPRLYASQSDSLMSLFLVCPLGGHFDGVQCNCVFESLVRLSSVSSYHLTRAALFMDYPA